MTLDNIEVGKFYHLKDNSYNYKYYVIRKENGSIYALYYNVNNTTPTENSITNSYFWGDNVKEIVEEEFLTINGYDRNRLLASLNKVRVFPPEPKLKLLF